MLRDRIGGKHSYHSLWDGIKAAVAAEAALPEDGSTERARRRLERLEAILQSLSRPMLQVICFTFVIQEATDFHFTYQCDCVDFPIGP